MEPIKPHSLPILMVFLGPFPVLQWQRIVPSQTRCSEQLMLLEKHPQFGTLFTKKFDNCQNAISKAFYHVIEITLQHHITMKLQSFANRVVCMGVITITCFCWHGETEVWDKDC